MSETKRCGDKHMLRMGLTRTRIGTWCRANGETASYVCFNHTTLFLGLLYMCYSLYVHMRMDKEHAASQDDTQNVQV